MPRDCDVCYDEMKVNRRVRCIGLHSLSLVMTRFRGAFTARSFQDIFHCWNDFLFVVFIPRIVENQFTRQPAKCSKLFQKYLCYITS
jgi:hypothetical protein